MASKKSNGSERAVVVTTAHRGVFVGHTTEPSNTVEAIDLVRAHMIVYWAAGNRGVLGIASKGPVAGSRVSPPVRSIGLRNVTAIMDASDEAVAAWEKAPWS
jgi:hypothetical protein